MCITCSYAFFTAIAMIEASLKGFYDIGEEITTLRNLKVQISILKIQHAVSWFIMHWPTSLCAT